MNAPETYVFDGDGRFPNSRLPALVYRDALPADADAMMRAFAANGWSDAWVDGIFAHHHFHSIAHEVLGIAGGEVQVALGGPEGRTLTLKAGDVVVIPTGVAHRNVGQSGRLRWSAPIQEERTGTSNAASRASTVPLRRQLPRYRPP